METGNTDADNDNNDNDDDNVGMEEDDTDDDDETVSKYCVRRTDGRLTYGRTDVRAEIFPLRHEQEN